MFSSKIILCISFCLLLSGLEAAPAEDNAQPLLIPDNVNSNQILIASSNVSTTENSTITAESVETESSVCFYANSEDCPVIEKNSTCQCGRHPEFQDSLICCNITDIQMVSSCNMARVTNIHIRNATLKELDISKSSFQALVSIAITDGKIKKIVGAMSRAAYVKCLNVSNNNITEIEYERAFVALQHFQMLDLSHNNMSAMPKLNSQNNISIDLRENKWILCNKIALGSTFKYIQPNNTFCLWNETYNWFDISQPVALSVLEHYKQLEIECPQIPNKGKCNCTAESMMYENNGNVLVYYAKVDCSGMGLTEWPPVLPKNTATLIVSNNNITSFGEFFHSEPTYGSVVRLNVDNNQITSMFSLEGTQFLHSFLQFYLRNNFLTKIPEYMLENALDTNPSGRALYLAGNELICDCDSAKIFKIWLLSRAIFIPDYNQILCRNLEKKKVVDLEEIKLCQSPHDWTDYIYYLITAEILMLIALVAKVSYDYWVFKTSGYLPWPANKMPKLPCDWLCES